MISVSVSLSDIEYGNMMSKYFDWESDVNISATAYLYNLSLRYREVSNEPVVLYTFYIIYIIYMAKDDYDHVEMLLHDLNVMLLCTANSPR